MKIELPLFIVFEGIDGSGKTTLSNKLYNFYAKKGTPVIKNREPTEGIWGKKIRDLLQKENTGVEKLVDLFIKDREEDVKKNIMPALNNGRMIIMDRYYFSNVSYQGAMGISPEYILNENNKRKFPKPHRVYLIDVDPQLAMKRVSKRSNSKELEIFEKKTFLEKVRKIYFDIADDSFLMLDGSHSLDVIMDIIKEDIENNFSIK